MPVEIKRDATAGYVEQYIQVGDLVLVDAHGETRSFTNKNDQERTVLEMIVARPGEGARQSH